MTHITDMFFGFYFSRYVMVQLISCIYFLFLFVFFSLLHQCACLSCLCYASLGNTQKNQIQTFLGVPDV